MTITQFIQETDLTEKTIYICADLPNGSTHMINYMDLNPYKEYKSEITYIEDSITGYTEHIWIKGKDYIKEIL